MFPLPFYSPYSQIFLAAIALWIITEWITGFRQRGARGNPAITQDSGSYLLLLVSIWLGAFIALWLSLLLRGASIRVDRGLLFFLGIALMMTGIALRWYANQAVRRGSPRDPAQLNGGPRPSLAPRGPYRYVRHPGYSGSLLIFLGVGLTLTNIAALVLLMVSVTLGHLYRIQAEERALLGQLGEPYREYMRHTTRVIPFLL